MSLAPGVGPGTGPGAAPASALSRGEWWAVTVVLAALVLVGAASSGRPPAVVVAATVVALGLTAALRHAGARTLLVGVVVVSAAVALLCSGGSGTVGWLASCVLVVVASFGAGLRHGLALAVAWLAVFAGNAAAVPEPGWAAWVGGLALTVFACWSIDRQRRLVAELEAAQAGLAARAASEERARIAREMHDVTGHALTVSLLHITAARLAVEDEPEVAAAALAEAERLSRRSLEEVRAAVGVLRDGSPPGTPLPGAADLPALVDAVARSGVGVTLRTTGDLGSLPGVAGLAAYRIVQESLTNVARHAPTAPTTVELEIGGDGGDEGGCVRLRVDSAAPGRDVGAGTGLASMRERAEALGGRLSAGPGGPGWRVEATWPRQPAGSRPRVGP
ncbi:hypothetical protein GCM10009737_05170 [Nocardioides lentus]|uniref:histidine kinase n=1 Tax=Nocardioides lentus TaxID=338077 RepID=A0ABN2P209_9ACTN